MKKRAQENAQETDIDVETVYTHRNHTNDGLKSPCMQNVNKVK